MSEKPNGGENLMGVELGLKVLAVTSNGYEDDDE